MGTDWKQWGEEGKESRATPRHVVWALSRKWCHHLRQESIGDRDSEGVKLQLRLPAAKSCVQLEIYHGEKTSLEIQIWESSIHMDRK